MCDQDTRVSSSPSKPLGEADLSSLCLCIVIMCHQKKRRKRNPALSNLTFLFFFFFFFFLMPAYSRFFFCICATLQDVADALEKWVEARHIRRHPQHAHAATTHEATQALALVSHTNNAAHRQLWIAGGRHDGACADIIQRHGER